MACACVLGGLYIARAPLLTAIANAWIVDEPLRKADAILVPGGGISWRPIEAARLYHEGYAPKILVLDVKSDAAIDAGVRDPDRNVMRQLLIKKDVADTNIVTIGKAVTTTWADVSAARDWAKETGAKRVLVVTDMFHTRRMKWITRRMLDNSGIESEVHAIVSPEYAVTNWWTDERGLLTFQNEVIKFAFYLVHYR